MENQYSAGDQVQLAPGSLPMTVVDVGALTGLVYCRWLDAAGRPRGDGFPAAALKEWDGGPFTENSVRGWIPEQVKKQP